MHWQSDGVTLYHGDCRDVLASLPDCSVDSIVTDPPYELGFMGKAWDASGIAYSVDLWREALRVLKPGGHLAAFGGTRTYHRMACAIEDAGFEIRDSLHWVYGSGFPKSLDVSKAIDKQRDDRKDIETVVRWLEAQRIKSGITRKQVEEHFGTTNIGQSLFTITPGSSSRVATWKQWKELKALFNFGDDMDAEVWRLNGRKGQPGETWAEREVVGTKTQNTTEESVWATHSGTGRFRVGEKSWDITAPATDAARQWDGWGTALKPAHEPIVLARKPLISTVAANVLQHGTGALNIDGARVGETDAAGRWPANVIFDTEAGAVLDEQSGNVKSGIAVTRNGGGRRIFNAPSNGKSVPDSGYTDTGGASRFFTAINWEPDIDVPFQYVPKPSKRERNCDGTVNCVHPTVKPLALMRWLVKLITPPGGTVLDPFAGSGTTLMAAVHEGFPVIGAELTEEYLPIIEGRVRWAQDNMSQRMLL